MDNSRLKKKDYRFFEMARREAEKSDFNHIHVGAVCVYKGHVIGQGCNKTKTHPSQKKANVYRQFNHNSKKPITHSIHAEVAAIKSIPYPLQETIDWSKVSLYVFRICKGKPLHQGLARPCDGCMSIIRRKGIHNVFYSSDLGYCYEEIY